MSTVFETTDLALAESELSRRFGPLRLSSPEQRQHFRLTHDDLSPVHLYRATLGMTLWAEVPDPGAYLIGRVLSGAATHETAHRRDSFRPGEAFLVARPDEPCRATIDHLDTDFAAVPVDLVDEVAGTHARFVGYRPVNAASARLWADTYAYVRLALELPGAEEPLVIGSLARLLAATALSTFPNTTSGEPAPAPARVPHPATLRRAMTFIDEHAQQDISPASIAAASFVSLRAVQLAFRRHLGTTPTTYLRLVRLQHAHRDLQRADPAAATVSDVATRWGFTNHSRFASYYRAEFGVPPSHTLRRR